MSSFPSYLKPGLSSAHATNPLPVILCLHGGGTNATIFNIQAMRLQRLLNDSFQFVFLDGPSVTSAGAGVMPYFEGCDPFFRWFRAGKDVNVMPPETRQQVLRALEYLDEEREAGEMGEVVGFLGFSQGAKLGAGLLWEQMVQTSESKWNFKFGVMCNGIAPPMCEVREEDKSLRITTPTLHVVGQEDTWRESSRKLYDQYFDKSTSNKFEFPIGHRLPTADDETKKIADEILRIWQSCGEKPAEKVVEKTTGKKSNLAAVVSVGEVVV
ncbi:putative ovarian cancer-associated gene 2 protein like protein [Amylocarpus encephaloides]|uniref:Ovarian cancer-associated gene 2 protein like protein n=1 Tax=Amylocarpus encephaloides TaxID=45428 RepID=A0A9P7YSI6_9HELO|nr:putative ovarian cancer-associated gene 2 protein like protein [Amylocarpus encephaloides]